MALTRAPFSTIVPEPPCQFATRLFRMSAVVSVGGVAALSVLTRGLRWVESVKRL